MTPTPTESLGRVDLGDVVKAAQEEMKQTILNEIETLDTDKPGEFGDGYKFAVQEITDLLTNNQ